MLLTVGVKGEIDRKGEVEVKSVVNWTDTKIEARRFINALDARVMQICTPGTTEGRNADYMLRDSAHLAGNMKPAGYGYPKSTLNCTF